MSADRGFELERRAHRLVWCLGYFARRDVLIYSEDNDQITDIDVIGWKFDDILTPSLVIVETKSEKGFPSILKLRGLIEYYSSNTLALMVRPNITPAIIKFAEQLGIRAMHTSRLDEVEEELKIKEKAWSPLSFSPDFDKRYLAALGLLSSSGYKKETLLRHIFWIEENPFHKLKLIKESVCNLNAKLPEVPERALNAALSILLVDFTALFSLSLLQVCSVLYTLPQHQRRAVFMDKFISGKLSTKEKQDIIDKTYTLISKYTKSILNAPPLVKREDFSLVPEYSDLIYALAERLLKRPHYSKELARLFDVYMTLVISDNKPTLIDLQGLLNMPKDDFDFTLKFARDTVEVLFGKKIPDPLMPLMLEQQA
jgi:hypothetical protein